MNNYGKFTEPETLQFERLLPGPKERVWDYLTKSELRGKWLASGSMDLREGGNVKLVFNHQTLHHTMTQSRKSTRTREK